VAADKICPEIRALPRQHTIGRHGDHGVALSRSVGRPQASGEHMKLLVCPQKCDLAESHSSNELPEWGAVR
jgi:hypothetical protein